MYRYQKYYQGSFIDFNQSCGMELDTQNEWVILGDRIEWSRMEDDYAKNFPAPKGRVPLPLRTALGAMIIQSRKGLSDRSLVKEIAENPYFQYFIGMHFFSPKCPFGASAMVGFRKRINADFLMKVNELYLENADKTPEHREDKKNNGTLILDATCSPSNIKYPQDFELLNDARVKLEEMIDFFHKKYHLWKKPRTYRKIAGKEYLKLAKTKKKTAEMIRNTIRKQLGYVKRDISYVENYLSAGCAMPKEYEQYYQTIQKFYEQQSYMYKNKTHKVKDRIVSLSQPHLRPIVRGKTKTPTEFGAKYDVSIDEKGHARVEYLSFDAYNECTVLQSAVERYKARNGYYPERVLADRIYQTKENRKYCEERGIRLSGPGLGKSKEDIKATKIEKKDNIDRIEVERFFSVEKRCNGGGLIRMRLPQTTLGAIVLSIFVTNLFLTLNQNFFLLFYGMAKKEQICCYFAIFEVKFLDR